MTQSLASGGPLERSRKPASARTRAPSSPGGQEAQNAALASGSPLDGGTRPLAIVHVVRQFHPGIGGLENFVGELSLRQARLGHWVRVVTLDRIFDDPRGKRLLRSEHIGDVEVVRLPFRGSKRYPIAPSVLGALKGADVVHVHGVDFFCDFLAGTALLHRKPLVLSTHGGFFHTSFLKRVKDLYFNLATRVSLSQFGAVIACSEEDEKTFRRVASGRLRLITNPVDIEKFEGLADPSSDTLIAFGRLAPNKELKRLIAWFAGLAALGPARLIIAGKPMGVTKRELADEAEALGIGDRVEIHESPTDDELARLISRSAIFCSASSYEGFGLAAIEAASAGLFPLLSDIPAYRDNVEKLGFGMLVDFQAPGSWSESYERFGRAIASFRKEFSQEKCRASVAPFGWEGGANRFDEVYRRVLGRSTRRIGPVNVEVTDRGSATAKILKCAESGSPMMVSFCNAHTVNLASRDGELRDALGKATILNDGVGLDIAGRALFGAAFADNLNGTDFVPHLLSSAGKGLRVFFLGGEDGVAKDASEAVAARCPNVEVAGFAHGFFRDEESGEILEAIRSSGANLVLVAMGQPRQEIWASRHFEEIDGPVICVGALFDFLAGRVPRAPAWVQRARIEWAFRLLHEPRRLSRRYLLGNPAFLLKVVRQKWFGSRI
ncbi:MAG TPA: WecB/TagA/CpsF family glycosyltransferase [Sphingomicrobium sp.]|nr:WecB/TagA/CpsF family glycosyltransferase [Sphingomicrobium sp.]